MKPNALFRNNDPLYLRDLLARAGLSQADAAQAIGVSPRQMRAYLSEDPGAQVAAPYCVQFALECLSLAASIDDQLNPHSARFTLAAMIAEAGGEVRIRRETILALPVDASIEVITERDGSTLYKLWSRGEPEAAV